MRGLLTDARRSRRCTPHHRRDGGGAQAAGLAAVSLDVKLVDFANLRMAERILAMSQT